MPCLHGPRLLAPLGLSLIALASAARPALTDTPGEPCVLASLMVLAGIALGACAGALGAQDRRAEPQGSRPREEPI